MKFVAIASAKGLVPGNGKEVYTLNDNGEYGAGRLISRTEDAKGLHCMWEVPQYRADENPPSLAPLLVSNITHVCIMKNRAEVGDLELSPNVPKEARV